MIFEFSVYTSFEGSLRFSDYLYIYDIAFLVPVGSDGVMEWYRGWTMGCFISYLIFQSQDGSHSSVEPA